MSVRSQSSGTDEWEKSEEWKREKNRTEMSPQVWSGSWRWTCWGGGVCCESVGWLVLTLFPLGLLRSARQIKLDIVMVYLLNTARCNYGEPLKHNPQSHTQTHKLPLTFTPPSKPSGLHPPQFPWRCSCQYSCIPVTVAAETKTWKPQKDNCDAPPSATLWRVCKTTSGGPVYPWQQGGRFDTKRRAVSIWLHFN